MLQLEALDFQGSSFVVFQTPSAGRWVLQPGYCVESEEVEIVSNPISGEVGAAAAAGTRPRASPRARFKPHQRGGGCCSPESITLTTATATRFKPHQRGGGCCSWQRLSSPVAMVLRRFKPHQRGGGCCSQVSRVPHPWRGRCFKPHQRGGGCCSLSSFPSLSSTSPCFKPHQRGGGCCSHRTPTTRTPARSSRFKPHQRGGGCCSLKQFLFQRRGTSPFQTP